MYLCHTWSWPYDHGPPHPYSAGRNHVEVFAVQADTCVHQAKGAPGRGREGSWKKNDVLIRKRSWLFDFTPSVRYPDLDVRPPFCPFSFVFRLSTKVNKKVQGKSGKKMMCSTIMVPRLCCRMPSSADGGKKNKLMCSPTASKTLGSWQLNATGPAVPADGATC